MEMLQELAGWAPAGIRWEAVLAVILLAGAMRRTPWIPAPLSWATGLGLGAMLGFVTSYWSETPSVPEVFVAVLVNSAIAVTAGRIAFDDIFVDRIKAVVDKVTVLR